MRQRWRPTTAIVGDDSGMTIAEIMVASLILVVAVLGVIGSMTSGMGLVGHSRQRSSGVHVAQERIERARNVAFADLALNEDPSPSTNPAHPDFNVTADDRYRLPDGTTEPLVIDLANGGLRHVDDPFTLDNTEFTVHQFVTWVDDAAVAGAQNYKRVSVVVRWKFPVRSGIAHTVTETTLVTDGEVNIPTPTPGPTPTPSGGPGGSGGLGTGNPVGDLVGTILGGNGQCLSDSTNPSMSEMVVLSGSGTEAGYLNATTVEVRFTAWDPECHPVGIFMKNAPTSDPSACTGSSDYVQVERIENAAASRFTVSWTIPAGDGPKSICAYAKNKADRTSTVYDAPVFLDQTRPSVPGAFVESNCEIAGSNRTVVLGWAASTDPNLFGYRVLRSAESNPFALLQQTATLSASDTTQKNLSSVRYIVRAYDKAGNESLDSPILSYARHAC